MPKKKLLIIVFISCFFGLEAQEKSSIKLRIEPGILLETDSDNLGLLLNIEPKIKSSANTTIGLRFGIAINPQKFEIDDSSGFFIDDLDDNAVISFVPTFDYYLNDNHFRPYVGSGIGYYIFNDIDISNRNNSSDIVNGSVNNQLGFLLRAGFELGNTRFGLEYDFIPKADIKIPDDQIIGTVDNSYFGVSIGFILLGKNRVEEL
ncbi:OmpW family outer membrane protein [Aquimarina algicola]|uniref:Porin family protein n=1 Tax=Aquimarina algicola TaxID=2589995 RepID=A0A504J7S1_9FLAO|nr:OmpW family outer membrane protein [Aquimarina algicola]TPN86906.1 hypothetical protein FHK87_04705 [Aquimarina algicola]